MWRVQLKKKKSEKLYYVEYYLQNVSNSLLCNMTLPVSLASYDEYKC